jgi:hypothetical protein
MQAKEQLMQELEQAPDALIEEVLSYTDPNQNLLRLIIL